MARSIHFDDLVQAVGEIATLTETGEIAGEVENLRIVVSEIRQQLGEVEIVVPDGPQLVVKKKCQESVITIGDFIAALQELATAPPDEIASELPAVGNVLRAIRANFPDLGVVIIQDPGVPMPIVKQKCGDVIASS